MNNLKDYVNWKLAHADKIAEAEGYPLTMENCKRMKKMKELKIYGNSIQDGTPTPDTPIEVVSVGNLSINLVEDVREVFKNFASYEELEEDSRQCIRMRSNGRAYAIFDFTFKENTQYTISFDYKCKYDRSGVSLAYDVPFSVFYTDGSSDACSLSPIDDIWHKRILTTKVGKTISHIIGVAYEYRVWNYIDINTFQIAEGTTTEYEPYGKYKTPVVIKGKNLATAQQVCNTFNNYEEITIDGRECIRYHNNGRYTDFPYKENTQYTITFDYKITRRSSAALEPSTEVLYFFYSDGTRGMVAGGDAVHTSTMDVWLKGKMTSKAGKTVVAVGLPGNFYKNWIIIDVNTFQFEESAAATEYEPYVEPVTTNIFLDEPLRKIGNYADYIDFKNKKVVRNVNVQTIERTAFDKVAIASNNRTSCLFWKDVCPNGIFPNTISKCNYFSHGYEINNFRMQDAIYFYLPTDVYPSDIEANAWLKSVSESDNPIVITYPLVAPTEETLILDLPKLNAKTTIIEVDTSLAPSNTYGKYIKK